jgi:hypothetical protein
MEIKINKLKNIYNEGNFEAANKTESEFKNKKYIIEQIIYNNKKKYDRPAIVCEIELTSEISYNKISGIVKSNPVWDKFVAFASKYVEISEISMTIGTKNKYMLRKGAIIKAIITCDRIVTGEDNVNVKFSLNDFSIIKESEFATML